MSNTDEKILKALADLQADVKGMKADVAGVKSDVTTIKDVQQQQGKRLDTLESGQKTLEAGQNALEAGQKTLEADVTGIKTDIAALRAGQKTLESGQQALELKIEAVHAYQKQAHNEIMEHLIESNEANGQVQQHLEQEINRIKKHVGLPPVK